MKKFICMMFCLVVALTASAVNYSAVDYTPPPKIEKVSILPVMEAPAMPVMEVQYLNVNDYSIVIPVMKDAPVTSQMASSVLQGVGLPAVEIKEDYVEEQNGQNKQIYADDRITLLHSDNLGWMRHHTPYEATDPVEGRIYRPVGNNNGQMLISNYRDKNGRYMEYTAEWIPQIAAPNKIVNINLGTVNS